MAKATDAGVKPVKTSKAKAAKPGKPNVFARLGQYFRDVRSEMKRVVWPQRPEVINSSIVVVVTLIFFVVLTLIVDSIIVRVISLIAELS